MARRAHNLRARWRLFHWHHGRTLAKCGRVGIFGEMGYHASEIAGLHHGVMLAAAALILIYLARVLAGEL